jgi:WD40 repeat protein/serine/threonine protein kinase
MSRRADSSRDLLFGLLALERGLIDQAQLLAAFQAWKVAEDRSMPEILREHGALDAAGAALVAGLAARRPGRGSAFTEKDRDDPDRTIDYVSRTETTVAPAGSYRVVRSHARGGLGEVFVALDPQLDREVALKELRAHLAYDPFSQSRFLLEAKVTGKLQHPGIVPVYGLGRHPDGRPYYAMRFIEGETLKQAIERFHSQESSPGAPRDREIAFRRLLRSLIDACNAVAYAHSRGVVHRDLKPENIMLGPFGETLVVDWGIAKFQSESASLPSGSRVGANEGDLAQGSAGGNPDDSPYATRPGAAIGTPQYMSPEQAAGDLERVGPASDVYSLGATLYCLLVGHGPFATGELADVLARVRRGVFPAPRRLRRSIDQALEATCLKAMALRPEERHAGPLALAEEIEAFLADVRFRGEQQQALGDAKRALVRLCTERACQLFDRKLARDGMLWLVRALENLPPDALDLARALRASLAGWHAGPKRLERTLSHAGAVYAVAFSPDGRILASASADRTARLWDLAKGGALAAPMRHQGSVRAIAFSPDGKCVATAGDDGTVHRWDALDGAAAGDPIRVGGHVTSLRFSPDGSKIAIAGQSLRTCLWQSENGRPVMTPGSGDESSLALAFDPSGNWLATAGADGRVRLRVMAVGALDGAPLAHGAPVTSLQFSPDGRHLVTGCSDGRARVWDAGVGKVVAELAHRDAVRAVDVSASGGRLATGSSDGTARLWDASSMRPIGEPLVHAGPVDCVGFGPDGTTLATASSDATVRLWDASTGLSIGPPLAHKGAVSAVAFSPDGQRLATACADGKVRTWRIPAPVTGDVERISCWVRVATELDFDEGDAIVPLDQLVLWELRRRLQELGGPPTK